MAVKRPLAAIVLAAGEGTRMRSETPKVLHPLAGRPMLAHLVDALTALSIEKMHIDRVVVVVGHGGTVLKSTDNGRNFSVTNRADRLSLAGVAAMENGNLILVGQGGVHAATPTGADLGQQQ